MMKFEIKIYIIKGSILKSNLCAYAKSRKHREVHPGHLQNEILASP